GLRHDARAPKSPDQKHSAAAVGRPAPVRGSASNYRETRTQRAQARRAGPEVARPKAQRGSSRATGACSGLRLELPGDANPPGSGTTRGPRSRPTKSTARQQSGDRRLFGARPRTTPETRDRWDQRGEAGPEVARPKAQPDQKHSPTKSTAPGEPA